MQITACNYSASFKCQSWIWFYATFDDLDVENELNNAQEHVVYVVRAPS